VNARWLALPLVPVAVIGAYAITPANGRTAREQFSCLKLFNISGGADFRTLNTFSTGRQLLKLNSATGSHEPVIAGPALRTAIELEAAKRGYEKSTNVAGTEFRRIWKTPLSHRENWVRIREDGSVMVGWSDAKWPFR
jgi:hypothetical protein